MYVAEKADQLDPEIQGLGLGITDANYKGLRKDRWLFYGEILADLYQSETRGPRDWILASRRLQMQHLLHPHSARRSPYRP